MDWQLLPRFHKNAIYLLLYECAISIKDEVGVVQEVAKGRARVVMVEGGIVTRLFFNQVHYNVDLIVPGHTTQCRKHLPKQAKRIRMDGWVIPFASTMVHVLRVIMCFW